MTPLRAVIANSKDKVVAELPPSSGQLLRCHIGRK